MLQNLISRAGTLLRAALLALKTPEHRPQKLGPAEADLLRAILSDFSGGNARTLEIGQAALQGSVPEDSIFSDVENPTVLTALATALDATGRLVWLNWKEPLDETADAFADLFLATGLDPEPALTRLVGLPEPKDGEAMAIAYLEFRRVADAAGWRLVSLNDGSDSYMLTLAPKAIAAKWRSVELGRGNYIADPDWQFLTHIKAAGLTPRSTQHPRRDRRSRPEPDQDALP